MDERTVGRACGLCINVDIILWIGESIVGVRSICDGMCASGLAHVKVASREINRRLERAIW